MKPVSLVSPKLADWSAPPQLKPPAPTEPVPLGELPERQPDPPQTAPDAPWDAGLVDPADVPPCPDCGSYELWESMTGNWRCLRCDPPHKARLLERKAARFRRLADAQLDRGADRPAPSIDVPTGRLVAEGTAEAACDRCKSTRWVDVRVPGTETTRRDCGDCGRFLNWAQWQGQE